MPSAMPAAARAPAPAAQLQLRPPAAAGGAPFPAQSLLERLWQDSQPSWAGFLPHRLGAPGLPGEVPAIASLGRRSDSEGEREGEGKVAAGREVRRAPAPYLAGTAASSSLAAPPGLAVAGQPPPTPAGERQPPKGAASKLDITGRVWQLSRCSQGCRDVQKAFDACSEDAERQALAAELHGHVREGLRCPHANHVLQKCITTLRPEGCQFIIEELMPGAIFQAARHKYGCRIIQRLFEHCCPRQLARVADAIISEVCVIARHPYGNYVVQHLLEFGTDEQRHRVLAALSADVRTVGRDSYGGAVLSAALNKGSLEDRVALSRALVADPGLLVFLACTRHGHPGAVSALHLLEGQEQQDAMELLAAELTTLHDSRYGRVVAAACLGAGGAVPGGPPPLGGGPACGGGEEEEESPSQAARPTRPPQAAAAGGC